MIKSFQATDFCRVTPFGQNSFRLLRFARPLAEDASEGTTVGGVISGLRGEEEMISDDYGMGPPLSYSLPANAILGDGDWRCAREYWDRFPKSSIACGCPECLLDTGVTLCWHVEDLNEGLPESLRRIRIVSLARLFDREMVESYVLPGYRYAAHQYLKSRKPS